MNMRDFDALEFNTQPAQPEPNVLPVPDAAMDAAAQMLARERRIVDEFFSSGASAGLGLVDYQRGVKACMNRAIKRFGLSSKYDGKGNLRV